MIKINFVCLGNICRSPMAEFVMKDLIAKAGLTEKIFVASSGCHAEYNTPMHRGTCGELQKNNIPFTRRKSKQFTREDYKNFDYIVGMDKENISDLKEFSGGDPDKKIFLMMSFAGENRGVADPYYTDDYETTYKDISRACKKFLEVLNK
ncbi:MAG: low molecular weight phosphotyrosine protein phosphatase [Selenomonadaceae bacterium]|nr:low molecular weight phosphotyrosine protein phosphatase [Selenomonadaceae bacterium]